MCVLQGMVKEVHPQHCKLTNGEEMDFGLAVWSTGGLRLLYVCLQLLWPVGMPVAPPCLQIACWQKLQLCQL